MMETEKMISKMEEGKKHSRMEQNTLDSTKKARRMEMGSLVDLMALHTKVCFTFSNAEFQKGDFKENNIEGLGTYHWADGKSYKGE